MSPAEFLTRYQKPILIIGVGGLMGLGYTMWRDRNAVEEEPTAEVAAEPAIPGSGGVRLMGGGFGGGGGGFTGQTPTVNQEPPSVVIVNPGESAPAEGISSDPMATADPVYQEPPGPNTTNGEIPYEQPVYEEPPGPNTTNGVEPITEPAPAPTEPATPEPTDPATTN